MNVVQYPVSVVNQSDYVKPYDWELAFDIELSRQWVSSTRNFVIFLAGFYVISIFSIQEYMKNRVAFNLKKYLAVWNGVLAVLSGIAFSRMFPEFSAILMNNGLHSSICEWKDHNITTAYWIYVLLLLKIVELGDTMFIVLRKQKILFLHWYHHVSVLVGSWLAYEIYEPKIMWFVTVNCFVHSIMYSYYALMATGIKIPRRYAMMITTIQILQMVMGMCVSFYGLAMLLSGTKCASCPLGLQIGFVLYIPFFYLFAKFFYDKYFCSPQTPTKRPTRVNDDRVKKQG